MKQLWSSRFLAAFVFTSMAVGLTAASPALVAQDKPKPPTEEEEETPAKPAKKPDKPDKKPVTEEEEEAPKPKPPPPGAKPLDGPINLAQEAKKAEHEQIRKLFEELAEPFDRVRTVSGKTYPRIAPLDVRFETSRSSAALKIQELTKERADIQLPRQSIERVEHYEYIVLDRVQKELLDSALNVPRSVLYRRAEMLLSEALRFSTKQDSVRKGDSWEDVRRKLRELHRSVRIAQVRALTDERSYRAAEEQARHLYNLKEPNQTPFAADRNLLDAIEYLYVTQARALLRQGQYLQARQALEGMLQKFTNVKTTAKANVEQVQKELQQQAQELVQASNALAEQKQFSRALQTLLRAEEAWPTLPGLRERRRELEGDYPTLRVGVRALPGQMSPTTAVSDADRMASKLIFESFLELRAGPSARDGYAYKLGLDLPRARQGVWELVLPADVLWSDGKPLTAADVKRGIEFLCDHRTPYYDPTAGTYLSQGNPLDGVRVEDNQRLTLALKMAHPDPFALMAFDLVPNHKFDPGASPRNTAFGARPVGTGPFVYQGTEGNEKVFVANPHYRRPHAPQGPAIREIRFVQYDDVEQAKQDVLAGKLQLLLDLPTPQADSLRGNTAVDVLTPTRPPDNTPKPYLTNPRVYFLAPNHRRQELQNTDLRRGIAWAIDREAILNKVFRNGEDRRAHQSIGGLFPYGSWAYTQSVDNPFRLESARGHFESARKQLGNLPSPTIKYPAEDEQAKDACGHIQTMLDAAGLKVQIQPVPRVQLAAELLKVNPDFELVYWHYDFPNETLSLWPLFDPNPKEDGSPGRNFMGYIRDNELAGFLQRLLAYRDLARLNDELQQMNAHINKEMIAIPLWQLDRHVVVHRSLKPSRIHPLWILQDVEEWQLGNK
jgi:ABC-type transport system substrate-binding protein